MQYKIPQNVGIEDKIVGPLSLRQLIIVAVGIGISWVLFTLLSKIYELNIVEHIFIALPALIAAAAALIKINDISLTRFLILFLEFSIKPQKRIWDHRGIVSTVSPDLEDAKAKTETSDGFGPKTKKAANLRELTKILDSGGFEHAEELKHKDIDEVKDDHLVSQAYFGNEDKGKMSMYWRTLDSHKKMLGIFAKMPVTQLKAGTKEAETIRDEIAKVKEEVRVMKSSQASAAKPPVRPAAPKTGQAAPSSAPADQTRNKRRQKKNLPLPIRKDVQVNTLQKNAPARYMPKRELEKPVASGGQKTGKSTQPDSKKDGEFHFEELKKGEIEINLD